MKWQASLKVWRNERNMSLQTTEVYDSMMAEEQLEYTNAIKQNDTHEIIDAICDQIVLTENQRALTPDPDLQATYQQLIDTKLDELVELGLIPDLAMKQTLKEISSRKQCPEQAKSWNPSIDKRRKDPNQDPSTLYRANYNLAKTKPRH